MRELTRVGLFKSIWTFGRVTLIECGGLNLARLITPKITEIFNSRQPEGHASIVWSN